MMRDTINVQINAEIRAILEEIAIQQSTDSNQRFAGDVIRDAIEEYLNHRGYDVKVEVNRSGWRGIPKYTRDGLDETK